MTKIVPAVDISKGKCVRLTKGKIEDMKVYYDDPLDAAKRWESEGAELLHVIDLDAAVGEGSNADVAKRIIKGISIPVEIGGGVRTIDMAGRYVDAGAERVIFGTVALDLKIIREALTSFGPKKVMAAVDHLAGRVAVKGWKELVDLDALLLCTRLEEAGVRNIMMTSIDRDGTMKGPNLEYSLTAATNLRGNVYLAGGFSTLDDLLLLKGSRVVGVIIGKALYEETIDLKDAKEVLA